MARILAHDSLQLFCTQPGNSLRILKSPLRPPNLGKCHLNYGAGMTASFGSGPSVGIIVVMPRVSVLTPVFNGMKFIGEAISSVASSTYKDYEHIIVDDGSTDETGEVIRAAVSALDEGARERVRTFYKANSGEAETDNFAFNKSSGDFIIVLNADDVISPYLIESSVAVMDRDNSVVVSYPDWTIMDAAGVPIRDIQTKNFSLKKLIGDFDCLPGPGACIRRSVLESGLIRNPMFPLISDYECWQRLALRGKFVRIPDKLASWRLHGDNLSLTSRGAGWAKQAILVADEFLKSPAVSTNRDLKNYARKGLSRAYFLAALQGNWDQGVPAFTYLVAAFWHGMMTGRPLAFRDLPLLPIVLFGPLLRAVRQTKQSRET